MSERLTGFDRVTRILPTGGTRDLTREEFAALPLSERIKAILGKQLRFYRDGKEIPAKEALADR